MSFKAQLKTEKFEQMLVDLQRNVSATSLQDVIDAETSKVLSSAATKTKQAGVTKIRRSDKDRTHVTLPNGKVVNPNWRLSQNDWRALKRARADKIKEKLRRVGLSRQAWIQIGEEMGLQVTGRGLAKARKATVNSARVRHKASGTRRNRGKGRIANVIVYGNPVGQFAGARSALQAAINGRVKFFERNVKTGVFDDAKSIAAKYPGIKISP